MKTEIFLVTYAVDYEWCTYTLRSIKRFGSGFAGMTMLVPYEDYEKFKPLTDQYGWKLCKYLVHPSKGFLHHMIAKCEADLWCPPDTNLIVHIDADCVFGESFTPETFMHGGKPILVREHFEDFRHYPARYSWKTNVINAIGVNPEWETMVRHPNVYHFDLYRRFRDKVEQKNKMSFHQYVILQKESFPMSFCEFPALGGFCLEYEPERYRIITAVTTPGPYWNDEKWRQHGIKPFQRDHNYVPVEKGPWHWLWHMDDGSVEKHELCCPIRYFWSRKGVTQEYKQQIEQMLA